MPKRELLTPRCESRLNYAVVIKGGTLLEPRVFEIRVYQESMNQVAVRFLASSFHAAAILLLANAIGATAQVPTAQIDRRCLIVGKPELEPS